MYDTISPNHDGTISVFGMTRTKLENGNTKTSFTPTGYWDKYSAGETLEIELKGEEAEELAIYMSEMDTISMKVNQKKQTILVGEGHETVTIPMQTEEPVEIVLEKKFKTAIKHELNKQFEECRIVSFYAYTEKRFEGKVTHTEGRKMFLDKYKTSERLFVSDIVVEVDGELKTLNTEINFLSL